jgi:hypothetical protein
MCTLVSWSPHRRWCLHPRPHRRGGKAGEVVTPLGSGGGGQKSTSTPGLFSQGLQSSDHPSRWSALYCLYYSFLQVFKQMLIIFHTYLRTCPQLQRLEACAAPPLSARLSCRSSLLCPRSGSLEGQKGAPQAQGWGPLSLGKGVEGVNSPHLS